MTATNPASEYFLTTAPRVRPHRAPSTKPLYVPFTWLVDTAEQENHAWEFQNIKSDADKQGRVFIVDTNNPSHYRKVCLGRHPASLGDYSIEWVENGQITSAVGLLAIERKARTDMQSTLLGFSDDRRERFEQELSNLAGMHSAVVIESTFPEMVYSIEPRGSKPAEHLMKTLWRSVLSLQMTFPRPAWVFAGDRAHAEKAAWDIAFAYWKKRVGAARAMARMAVSQ